MSYTSTMANGSTKEYLSAAETAALLRKALAKSFPGQKFYVRSQTYAGGASIDVYYDGATLGPDGQPLRVDVGYEGVPTGRPLNPDFPMIGRAGHLPKPGTPAKRDVEKVADPFAGGGFDGMIDLAYPISASIDADGNVTGTRSGGSGGSRGLDPAWDTTKPGDRIVSFGAKYVFVNDEEPYDVRARKAAS